MAISDQIMGMIEEAEFVVSPVTETSHLYRDLGYDSLSFVCLLLKIEKAFSIQFELLEMGACLQADRLIALVRRKLEEAGHD